MVKYLSTMLNLGINQQYFNNAIDIDSPLDCRMTLKNKDLWNTFTALETEMIITKSGRRMFPSIVVQIKDLSPNSVYSVYLEMEPVSRTRFKYSSSGGWFPAGSEEAHSPQRFYLHPDSPARGDYWMSQSISFGKLKLTNTIAPPGGQVVLSSMHKYQPKIIIAKTADIREINWAPKAVVAFPETQFIAVTAYQNEKVTKLKIDNNPFAKGFRENGQAKCKRKKVNRDEKTEDVSTEEEHLEDLPSVDERLSPSSSCNSSISSRESYDKPKTLQSNQLDQSHLMQNDSLSKYSFDRYSPSSSTSTLSSVHSYQSDYRPLVPNALHRYQFYDPYSYISPTMWRPIVNLYPQYVIPSIRYRQESNMEHYSATEKEVKEKPKKLTDFSIRAITGYK